MVSDIERKTRIWLNIVILQSLLAVLWLLLIPGEEKNAVILGYSLKRLALLIPLFIPVFASLFLKHGLNRLEQWHDWLRESLNKAKLSTLLVFGGGLLSVVVWSFLFLFHFLEFFPDPGAYIRLLPLLLNYLLLGLESQIYVHRVIFPNSIKRLKEKISLNLRIFLISFLLLCLCIFVVEITGWGKAPEWVSTVSLGVPILEGQIWYVIGVAILCLISALAWKAIPVDLRRDFNFQRDTVIFLVLWMFAVAIWMSLPLPEHNYFAPSDRAPNFEKYPFSDAEQYDSNALYVQYGTIDNFVISKPLYVAFLTILHMLVGISYERVVLLQTLVIALFPGMLFLIGRELHSRLGGIAIGLLAILREVNSIQASTMTNVTNSKLLLSDMPAALLAGLLVYVLIRWLKGREVKVTGHLFIIGGILGAFILTRIQTFILIPFMLVLVIFRYLKKPRILLVSCLLMLLAVGITIAPILVRNHGITGVYWVDNPASSSALARILTTGIDLEEELPGITENNGVLDRNSDVIALLIKERFSEFLGFFIDNFFRNEISSMLVLPVRLGNSTDFLDYLRINRPFWSEVYTKPNFLNLLIILINSAIMCLGFTVTIKKNPWAGFSILGLHLVYSLSSAVVRLSGWRFILPVDWILYSFFVLGLIELIFLVVQIGFKFDLRSHMEWLTDFPKEIRSSSLKPHSLFVYGLLFIFFGGFIPLRENLFPVIAPEYDRASVCKAFIDAVSESDYPEKKDEVEKFCFREDTRALMGIGIYPRFFKAGEGYYDRSYDLWFGEQDFSRLVFKLVGNPNAKVYIKTEEETIKFPNGALVYVLGRDKLKFEAQWVLVTGEQQELIISSLLIKNQAERSNPS